MLLLAALLVSLPFVVLLAFRPVERRLALRYPRRRRVEAALVILGSLLGTAIITGSLVVGDTIDRSIRASAYEQLGPIDEVIAVGGVTNGEQVTAQFEGFSSPQIDGVLRIVAAPASVVGRLDQPRAQIVEVDFKTAHSFGGDPSITGVDGPTPARGHAVLTTDLGARTAAKAGDRIAVYAYGQTVDLTVDRVIPRRGVAGFWPLDQRAQSYNVFVAPGTIAALSTGGGAAGGADAERPTSFLVFSNVGGVESGARRTQAAVTDIQARLSDVAVRVQPVKSDLLRAADKAATSLRDMYFTMGMFAVSAGVLLLVNIFVMLGDERRSELGMLRALGLRRLPLVGAFATEGWLYSLVASAVGALGGIGVGRVIAWRADQILSRGDEVSRLHLTFSFNWSTVVNGFVIGLLISLGTIVFTSIRMSRLNVIAAIRDLPAVHRSRARTRWVRLGFALAGLGAVWAVDAAITGNSYGLLVGPAAMLIGIAPALTRRLPVRPVVVCVGVAVLAWSAGVVAVIGAVGAPVTIPLFLVQGLAMAGAAVAVVSVYQAEIGRLLARMTSRSLSVRVGLAYPIARRFRTAMTLAMFAIVVLTLVYLSIISFMFRNQLDTFTASSSGGFGVVVTSNPTNPVPVDQLSALPGVRQVAPLAYGFADFVSGSNTPIRWRITGFGAELAAAPPALKDRGGYASDVEAWRAVSRDPGLVIVDQYFLAGGGGPPQVNRKVGDALTVIDLVTGASRNLILAAITKSDFVNSGAWYGIQGYQQLFPGRSVPSRYYVKADDPTAQVNAIRSRFIGSGADAEAVRTRVEGILSQNSGFFTLMQQFVGIGLIVGIAGIGVLLVRAVRERRRDIGVLRSLGFQPRSVADAFLAEAAFVAVEGVLIGIFVALVGSYGLVASGNNFTETFTWGVPWGEVGFIAAIALVTSSVIALWPARRAAGIHPAVALRTAD